MIINTVPTTLSSGEAILLILSGEEEDEEEELVYSYDLMSSERFPCCVVG